MVLLWVVGYGAVYTAAQWLSSSVPVGGLIVSGLMAAYCVLLFLWSWRYNREKNICLNAVNWKKLIKDPAILSLLLLPMYNLMTGGYVEHSVQKIVLILSVALIEELFFRGYLLNYLKNQGRLLAVIASSAIFALMHGANFSIIRDG